MGIDDIDSAHRKHHREPSVEAEEKDKPSKRHKHRHHHHHRHHRSHKSKKYDEDIKTAGGDDDVTLPSSPPPSVAVASVTANDDVEEGEILDEEESNNINSQNLIVHADNGDSCMPNSHSKATISKDSMPEALDDLVFRDKLKSHANGDLDHETYYKEGKKRHGESKSYSLGVHKRKSYQNDDKLERDESKFSDSGSGSLSREYVARERSRSRSVVEEDATLKRRRHYEKADDDSADVKLPEHDKYSHRGNRDADRECSRIHSKRAERNGLERVLSPSYSRREGRNGLERARSPSYSIREEIHGSGDSLGREREMDSKHRREHEKERSWERDLIKENDRESRDRDLRREKERERSRDREIDRDHRQEKVWEKNRERDDRDHQREKELERRSWYRELVDRDRRKERQRDRSLDWDVDRDRRRERARARSKEREEELDQRRRKERERSKDVDMSRASERYRDRGRERDRDSYSERDRVNDRDRMTNSVRRSDRNSEKARNSKSYSENAYNSNDDSLADRDKQKRDEGEEEDDFEERIALKLAEQEEDLDRVKEESRKRRQAILEKYKNQQKQKQNETQTDDVDKADGIGAQHSVQSLPAANVAPETMHVKIESDASAATSDVASESIYVKTESDDFVTESGFSVGKSPLQSETQASERTSGAAGLGEGTPKSEGSDEKYCDDIFADTPAKVRKPSKGDGLPITRSSLYDNWDDADGYYGHRVGETLDGRYEIIAAQGKGVFSTVVRAKDLKAGIGEPQEVAIKILRNNEQMLKAGQNEVQIFSKLAAADPENKRHCVRFLSSFKYRNHLCLVFESLHMNLREVLKKFGRNIGLKLTAVRAYAKQLFIALKHLKNCEVLHCDIKPDNMLVNGAKNVLKLCDFGNAMLAGKNEITPYLVSRFYRAPEIILGLSYDHPVDMWAVGCCLYELYAGKVLFPGATNNDMLRLHMELKGPFPKKMLKKGGFVDHHFDQDLNFNSIEEDPVTKKIIKRVLINIKQKDIGSIISSCPGEDPKMAANFKDLLDKIFVLDPEKRLTVSQALAHPFITGK